MKTALIPLFIISAALSPFADAAEPAIDTSTPKGTVKGFYDLAATGDFDGLKRLFAIPSNDQEKELLENGLSDDFYIPALSAAILEKFPGAKVPNTGPMLVRAKGGIDQLAEKVEGETATLAQPGQPDLNPQHKNPFLRPLLLRKENGAWKIAVTEGRFLRLPPPQMRALHKARCEAMVGFIADAKAGKYASFEECDEAMKQKLALIKKARAATPGATTGLGPCFAQGRSPGRQNRTGTSQRAPIGLRIRIPRGQDHPE